MKTLYESMLNRANLGSEAIRNEIYRVGGYSMDGECGSIDKWIENCLKNGERRTKSTDILFRFGSFVKEKYNSSVVLYFWDDHKWMHIHKYEDMHIVELTCVIDETPDWPKDSNIWKNQSITIATRKDMLDERASQAYLSKIIFQKLDELNKAGKLK